MSLVFVLDPSVCLSVCVCAGACVWQEVVQWLANQLCSIFFFTQVRQNERYSQDELWDKKKNANLHTLSLYGS